MTIIASIPTGDSLQIILLSLSTSLSSRIVKRNLILLKSLFVLSTQMPFKALILSNPLFKHSLATLIEFGTNTPKLPTSLSALKLGGMIIVVGI